MMGNRPFIRGQVAINSMRDNGFTSAAHALAELIDNSIQAKADRVELITFERRKDATNGGRAVKSIEKIGVLDNGTGMSPETLHFALEFGASKNREDKQGIGKFGMGLPNASISQCKRVDVWSWTTSDAVNYTYLDIDEIVAGNLENIPAPEKKALPNELVEALGDQLPKSGTFVLWSKIDRCQWKTSSSILRHTQDTVGRMYRKFLNENNVAVVFRPVEFISDGTIQVGEQQAFQCNDPMYLMRITSLPSLPGELKGEAAFELLHEPLDIPITDHEGQIHSVKLTTTVVKKSVVEALREQTSGQVGATVWGKHFKKNLGVSIVRAGRELLLTTDFFRKGNELKEQMRYVGIELSFGPELDQVFGVTNNKQAAVNLRWMNIEEDAEREGFESTNDYESDLLSNNDPKLQIYKVIKEFEDTVAECWEQRLASLTTKGTKNGLEVESDAVSPLVKKLNELDKRREDFNPTDDTDVSENEAFDTLVKSEVAEPEARLSAKAIVENDLGVWIENIPLATQAFFDVTRKKGLTLLQINTRHAFYTEILEKLPNEQRDALEICLAGWARMEKEERSDKRKVQLENARKTWGQLLEDYLDPEEEA